jgi:ABC-type branched-subunit amino acid transport system ATPase component
MSSSDSSVPESLRCDNIRKSFNGVLALRDVTLNLPGQGIIAIIGPNGAGKTTLINVLTGFMRPDSGSCRFRGLDLTKLRPYQIARLGLARTFQDVRIVAGMSVVENVMLACPQPHSDGLWGTLIGRQVCLDEQRTRQSAIETLAFVGLDRESSRMGGAISYGQQKLLTLACCLASGANALLLDEPVAGVHPQMSGQIISLLRELKHQGKLIVFIEHDIAAVRELADEVIVLDEGKVIARGQTADVLDRRDVVEAYLG